MLNSEDFIEFEKAGGHDQKCPDVIGKAGFADRCIIVGN
jgi:hypothetical protein